MWAEKRQLQNGADAGALAIAQDVCQGCLWLSVRHCAELCRAEPQRWHTNGTVVSLTSNSVTVKASDPHENWFAQMIGAGDDSRGQCQGHRQVGLGLRVGTFPLTFSWCEWKAQTGGLASTIQHRIITVQDSRAATAPVRPATFPGGFGWVNTNAGRATRPA